MNRHVVATRLALAFALALGTAGVAAAQDAHQQGRPERSAADSGFRRGPGRGRENMLLKGITLTTAQKDQLKALGKEQRKEFGGKRPEGNRGVRGDTTGFGARRAEMEQRREKHFAAVRSILDANQRAQLDRNISELKAHNKRG